MLAGGEPCAPARPPYCWTPRLRSGAGSRDARHSTVSPITRSRTSGATEIECETTPEAKKRPGRLVAPARVSRVTRWFLRLGDQRLFEVLAERGLHRVKLAHRGSGQIGFEDLLDPGEPLFLVALEILLVGPESDRQHFFRLDLGHQGQDFEEAILRPQNWLDLFFYDTNEFVF